MKHVKQVKRVVRCTGCPSRLPSQQCIAGPQWTTVAELPLPMQLGAPLSQRKTWAVQRTPHLRHLTAAIRPLEFSPRCHSCADQGDWRGTAPRRQHAPSRSPYGGGNTSRTTTDHLLSYRPGLISRCQYRRRVAITVAPSTKARLNRPNARLRIGRLALLSRRLPGADFTIRGLAFSIAGSMLPRPYAVGTTPSRSRLAHVVKSQRSSYLGKVQQTLSLARD